MTALTMLQRKAPVRLTPSSSLTVSSPPSLQEVVLDSVESAIEAIQRGEFVVVVDDMDRENEGDLIIAAEKITTEGMAWMIRHTS